jgi:hypothetical protein
MIQVHLYRCPVCFSVCAHTDEDMRKHLAYKYCLKHSYTKNPPLLEEIEVIVTEKSK